MSGHYRHGEERERKAERTRRLCLEYYRQKYCSPSDLGVCFDGRNPVCLGELRKNFRPTVRNPTDNFDSYSVLGETSSAGQPIVSSKECPSLVSQCNLEGVTRGPPASLNGWWGVLYHRSTLETRGSSTRKGRNTVTEPFTFWVIVSL